ncbi:hypothetical protein [Streptomyces sp. HPF1205]|uniref:hypothetical protein n=1 Tax=Streptomyces sp. HPF1205 TaxID=2873262 RepID=UPI001CEDABE5|nr:hypothetical protein [Streptomyces sp. HPF1205]
MYRHRNTDDVVGKLPDAPSTFICWGKDYDNKIWYWAYNDHYWGNVRAADLTTRLPPFPNLREC